MNNDDPWFHSIAIIASSLNYSSQIFWEYLKLKQLKGIFLPSNFMKQLLLLMWSTSRFLFRHWKQEKDWRWERKHDCKIFFLLKTLMGNRGSCQFAPLWSFRVESISRKLTARNSDCRKCLQFFLHNKKMKISFLIT